MAGFDGKQVRLQGQLIYREGGTMVEITPGSIHCMDTAPAVQATTRDLGTVTVTGEIVDSKCYLGVMNPGQGKVHRDCAARCLSGGIPPIFVTTDGHEQFLLVGLDGRALGRDALREFIAEPIQHPGRTPGGRLNAITEGRCRARCDIRRTDCEQHQKALRSRNEEVREVQC